MIHLLNIGMNLFLQNYISNYKVDISIIHSYLSFKNICNLRQFSEILVMFLLDLIDTEILCFYKLENIVSFFIINFLKLYNIDYKMNEIEYTHLQYDENNIFAYLIVFLNYLKLILNILYYIYSKIIKIKIY